jgi:hypothetical protein
VDNTPDRRTTEHTSLTPAQRTARARIAAHSRWAHQDGSDGTARARAAFLARFEREVDPDGVLDPVTRAKRAEHARRAHFQRMAQARHRKAN